MSLSKLDQPEMSNELHVLLDHKKPLTDMFRAMDLLLLSEELEKHLVISKEVAQAFHSLDHEKLDIGLKARYLLQQVYVNVKGSTALFDNFLIVLNNVDKRSMCRQLTNHINRLRGRSENDGLLEKDLPVLTGILAVCAKKWEEIGLMLRLPINFLDEINRCYNTDLNKLYRVLMEWLTGNYEPVTLAELQEVLNSDLVAQKQLASNLEKLFTDAIAAPPEKKTKIEHSFRVVSQSLDIEIADGKSVLLEVQVVSQEPASFVWTKNDQPLSEGELYSGTKNNILLVRRVSEATKGVYKCSINEKNKTNDIVLSVIYSQDKQDKHDLIIKYSNLPEIPDDSWATACKFINLALIKVHRQHRDTSKYFIPGDIEAILQKKMERKQKVSYEELFGEYKSGALVLVEGRPGSGKTTLACKVTRDWAKGNILRYADCVVLLPLRGYQENERIKKEFLSLRKKAEQLKGKGFCFILDGLDEWQLKLKNDKLMDYMIKREYLPQAMVVVMSRPAATKRYREFATQRVEILGFSKKEVYEYIKMYPFEQLHDTNQENENMSSKLIKYLNTHTNVLHMCYLPVHAAMICFLYSVRMDKMPQTETQIYEYFTCSIILRKLQQSDSSVHVHSLDELDDECEAHFLKVCKLAFDMICDSKQVVQDRTTFTLNSKCPPNSLLTIDTVAQIYGVDNVITFLHLTLQEYLAARHIAGLTVTKQSDVIKTYAACDHMQNTWKFYSGVSANHEGRLALFEQLLKALKTNHLHKVECAFESQQPEFCTKLVEVESGDLSFHSLVLKPADFTTISFVLTKTSFHLSSLEVRVCTSNVFDESVKNDGLESILTLASSPSTDLKNIVESLKNAFPALLEQYRTLPEKSCKEIRQKGAKAYESLASKDLSTLGIGTGFVNELFRPFLSDNNNILTSEYSSYLVQALQHCGPHLCILNLSGNVFGSDGAADLKY